MKNIPYEKHVLVCLNDTCKMQGSEKVYDKLKARIKELNLKSKYRPSKVVCLGICGKGPSIAVWPEGTLYCGFTEEKIEELIQKHLINGEVLNECLYKKDSQS